MEGGLEPQREVPLAAVEGVGQSGKKISVCVSVEPG